MTRIAARGVRRSCDTHATNSRRDRSTARSRPRASSRRSSVISNSRASATSSGAPWTAGATLASVVPIRRVTATSDELVAATWAPSQTAAATPTVAAASNTTSITARS